MELLAEGRTAEVYAYGEGRVLKLDRPEWNGLSTFEATVLGALAEAGLPVARQRGTVTVEGRSGVLLDRVDGPPLLQVLAEASPGELDALAGRFVALQLHCNETTVGGLPELVPRLGAEIGASVSDDALRTELLQLLEQSRRRRTRRRPFRLPSEQRAGRARRAGSSSTGSPCAAGPSAADLARTLVLWGRRSTGPVGRFLRGVRREGRARRGLADEDLDAWIRVVAAARVAEGFEGEERAWLLGVASGAVRLFA